MTDDVLPLSLAEATDLLTKAFLGAGASETNACSVAAALVAAEAEGQVGHGFSRVADYAAQVQSGKVDGMAVPECTHTGAASLQINAKHGFAYPALDLAMTEGLAVAQSTGCAAIGIAQSHHCGALSVQVDRIARAGMIGLMMANTPVAIAPWGGKTPLFGTNPIAFAAPRGDNPPLVIDLSLSRVARGKVMNAKKTNQPIPEGWALDADGQPTTDPSAGLQGSMVPMGEAKGTALALMVEVMAAAFTGANPSTNVTSYFTADGPPPGSGQFLLMLRPGADGGFAARLEQLLAQISGTQGARLPGMRRLSALETAHRDGLRVPRAYVEGAQVLGAGYA